MSAVIVSPFNFGLEATGQHGGFTVKGDGHGLLFVLVGQLTRDSAGGWYRVFADGS